MGKSDNKQKRAKPAKASGAKPAKSSRTKPAKAKPAKPGRAKLTKTGRAKLTKTGRGKPAKRLKSKVLVNTTPEAPPDRPRPPLALGPSAAVLDRLWSVIVSRRTADPAVSHSARLLSRGTAKVAQKLGEEAVECLIEAVLGNRDAVIAESADVLYHLMVLWVATDVAPEEVWAELKRREGVSGIAEKASRAVQLPIAFGLETTKIP
jgi:phosphoribosyl-ATP pyrophosphohydrolase